MITRTVQIHLIDEPERPPVNKSVLVHVGECKPERIPALWCHGVFLGTGHIRQWVHDAAVFMECNEGGDDDCYSDMPHHGVLAWCELEPV